MYVPEDIDLFFKWRAAAVASEMGAEELSQRMDTLFDLLGRGPEGDEGSDNEPINETLRLVHGPIRNLSVDRLREGALFVLYELSLGREYVLAACDPPACLISDGLEISLQFRRGWVPGLDRLLQLSHSSEVRLHWRDLHDHLHHRHGLLLARGKSIL
ncbi:MAG: hypothetical protein QI223_01495 [Candidatus Korarchaeota archaeon]|nr:hypothetical protein [Candidatus Korarchaeota archaeon]